MTNHSTTNIKIIGSIPMKVPIGLEAAGAAWAKALLINIRDSLIEKCCHYTLLAAIVAVVVYEERGDLFGVIQLASP
jgi:hypothetical protein